MRSPRIQRSTARSAPLDGLRALAALSVLCFHVWLYAPGGPPETRSALSDKLMFELNLGLICFFVLSGFLLFQAFARASLAKGDGVNLKSYATRRAARIIPAYYACLAGCLLLYWIVGLPEMNPTAGELPLFAVFGQNFSPDTVMTFNPVTWTLSVEASLYLMLPLIGLAAFRLGHRRAGLQVALLLSLIGVTLVWNAMVFAGDWRPIGPKVLPAYIGHFALGMLGALWFEHRRKEQPSPLGAGATSLIVGLGVAFVVLGGYWHETVGRGTLYTMFSGLPAALGFALVIAASAAGSGPVVSCLRWRPLVAIGVISYGVYLWHLPLLLATRHLEVLPDAFVPRTIVVLVLALGAGCASWFLIEKPLIRRFAPKRDRARSVRPRPEPAAQFELARS
jgi:peptidoglycan/LPS O-acetylase OafA/YrhL